MRRFSFRMHTYGEAVSLDVFDVENGPFCYAEEALAELEKLRAENEALRKQVTIHDEAHTELCHEVEAMRELISIQAKTIDELNDKTIPEQEPSV